MVYIKTKEGASLWIALLATAIVAGTMTLLDAVWWVTLCVCGAVFVVVALVALFFAWRRIFRPARACAPDDACAVPQVRTAYKVIFWIVTALVLIALVFPYLMPLFY